HDRTGLFQRLTVRDWEQAGQRHLSAPGVAPDGRREFGVVRDAIVTVLGEAEGELQVRDIHARVEKLLGEPVSKGSVKAYLHGAKFRNTPLFEYHGSLGYRLAR